MASGILNLSEGNPITGINVIGGRLYWTDDRNEPRAVDIEAFKAADHTSGTTRIYSRQFQNRDITVIRPHPCVPPTIEAVSDPGAVETPFSDVDPRFSYRWRYNTGQYSPFCPFTASAFIPAAQYDVVESFRDGLNASMINAANRISISGIPIGGPDVEAVDVLYTESISSTIYVIETVVISNTERNRGVLDEIILSRRSFKGALPPNQLLRNFDNVPRAAKAQEITANRIIYGNYLQNYDQPETVSLTTDTTSITASGVTSVDNSLTVKTNRTYDLGIAFIDEFGRQGGLLNSPNGSVSTPFSTELPLSIVATVDVATTPAPSWARKYRYYIKDISTDHHNLVAQNSYHDTELDIRVAENTNTPYIWQGFNSTDRNKITDDTVLIPRRTSIGTGSVFTEESRHPVVDIENELPQILIDQAIASGGTTEADMAASEAAIRASAQGLFFVKIKRDTERGSIGLLPVGQTDPDITDGTTTTGIAVYELRSRNAPDSALVVFRYTQVGQSEFSEITLFSNDAIEIRSSSVPLAIRSSNFSSFSRITVTPESESDFVINEDDLNLTWFETAQTRESLLDLYWESNETFNIGFNSDGSARPENDYGDLNTLGWKNAVGFFSGTDGVFIESQRINDSFNSVQLAKGVRVNTPQESYEEDRRGTGLIFSGLFNDRSGVDRLNEFIAAEGITQELLPNYGTIQKLHTRDNYLISLCESKIFRTLADKDLLFNADGGSNVSSTALVLGDTSPVVGEYGISTNPESFATYANNIYFTDRMRGAVMQYTPNNGQLFEISQRGMSDFFRDRFAAALPNFKAEGSFNDYKNSYIISLQNYNASNPIIGTAESFADTGSTTVAYDLDTEKWPSRFSFIPEGGLSLNNRYYTWNNGRLWLHNSIGVNRNNFYGEQFETTWDIIANAGTPSVVKNWVSLGYEGSDGWELVELSTEDETSGILGFVEKEGKFHGSISGTEPIYSVVGADTTPEIEGDIVDNGFRLRPTGQTRITSGIKGLYATVRVRNQAIDEREIHSINTTFFNSSY